MKRSRCIKLSPAVITNNFNRLSLEELGAYVRLLALMGDEPLADDEFLLRLMGVNVADWHRLRTSLLRKGVLAVTRGGLVNAGAGVS